jgi:hypothetical protein
MPPTRKRCPNGQRKNKKTGECEKYERKTAAAPTAAAPPTSPVKIVDIEQPDAFHTAASPITGSLSYMTPPPPQPPAPKKSDANIYQMPPSPHSPVEPPPPPTAAAPKITMKFKGKTPSMAAAAAAAAAAPPKKSSNHSSIWGSLSSSKRSSSAAASSRKSSKRSSSAASSSRKVKNIPKTKQSAKQFMLQFNIPIELHLDGNVVRPSSSAASSAAASMSSSLGSPPSLKSISRRTSSKLRNMYYPPPFAMPKKSKHKSNSVINLSHFYSASPDKSLYFWKFAALNFAQSANTARCARRCTRRRRTRARSGAKNDYYS